MIERIVGDRYRILRNIGYGGFGQTYLAEDSNRFNEICVLKELAPAAENQDGLEKAKELFAREAEVLYKLQHPQIPRFREWFIESTRQSLFLVQDYVEGPTYLDILRDRKPQTFSESEIVTLFTQLLPVLSYLHGRGVVHRDLSPDNLICRNSDRLPVLIDFGGVKAGTASISQSAQRAQTDAVKPNVTLIGKPGYSPEEQMRQGQVSAASDLYALGVTALVLLTGQEPADLYDAFNLKFDWQRKALVSPGMTAILEKLVAYKVSDRYTDARQVLQDLQQINRTPQIRNPASVSDPQPVAGARGVPANLYAANPPAAHPNASEANLGSASAGGANTGSANSGGVSDLGTHSLGSTKTLVVAPAPLGTAIASEVLTTEVTPSPKRKKNSPSPKAAHAAGEQVPGSITRGLTGLARSLLVIMLLLGSGALGWVAVRSWLDVQQRNLFRSPSGSPQSYSIEEKQPFV